MHQVQVVGFNNIFVIQQLQLAMTFIFLPQNGGEPLMQSWEQSLL